MSEWIVLSCVLMAAVLVLRRLLRRRLSARFQYALWALVLVRLLVPVSFGQSPVSIENRLEEVGVVQAAQTVRGHDRIEYTGRGSVVAYGASAYDAPQVIAEGVTEAEFRQMETVLTAREMLLPLWWAGMAVMAASFLWSNARLRRRLRRSRRPLDGTDSTLPVYVTAAVETPCLFGLVRPATYVTPRAAEDAQTLRHVLAHEQTHYRHGDHIWSVLRCVCLCLHWYNPLVWVCAVLSRRDGELACDEGTLGRIGEEERLAYGRTLLDLTCAGRGSLLTAATTMTDSKKSITERVRRIARRPRTAAYAAVLALLAAAVTAGCTFTGANAAEPQTPQTAPDPSAQSTAQTPDSSAGEAVLPGEGTAAVLSDVTVWSGGERIAPYCWEIDDGQEYTQLQSGADAAAHLDALPEIFLRRDFDVRREDGSTYAGIRVFAPDGTPVHPDGRGRYDYAHTEVFWLGSGTYICTFPWAKTEQGRQWCAFRLRVDGEWDTVEPLTPERMGTITSAQLWSGGASTTVTDRAALDWLEKTLKNAKPTYAGACPFVAMLYLTLEDGTVLACTPAGDSCGLVGADGQYYDYGSENNADFWPMFSSFLEDQRFVDARALEAEEIDQVNAAFEPLVTDAAGELQVNPLCGFFASDYDTPNDLDLTAFLRYFPGGTSGVTDEEFQALRSHALWPFPEAETLQEMPVPIHKYTSDQVEEVLWRYAGLGLGNLTGRKESGELLYLPQYDAWYNFTSDFGPAMFVCESGQEGNGWVRLRSVVHSYDNTRQELILEYTSSGWVIHAHRTVPAG